MLDNKVCNPSNNRNLLSLPATVSDTQADTKLHYIPETLSPRIGKPNIYDFGLNVMIL